MFAKFKMFLQAGIANLTESGSTFVKGAVDVVKEFAGRATAAAILAWIIFQPPVPIPTGCNLPSDLALHVLIV